MKLFSAAALLIIIFFVGSCSRPTESNTTKVAGTKTQETKTAEMGESQAVQLAETFIALNGYTDLPPDREHLAYETIEWESNVDETLRMRHDTLERKAYGLSRGRKDGSPGWTVVFQYRHLSHRQKSENGRAVTMNSDGGEMRVEHVDYILGKVERRL